MKKHHHPLLPTRDREDSRRAADRAGVRGRSAPPMSSAARERIYRQQTGRRSKRAHRAPSRQWWWLRDDLTPRQRRRWQHKANRAACRPAPPRHDS